MSPTMGDLARCAYVGCEGHLVLTCHATLVTIRCDRCRRLVEHHEVWADGWERA